MHVHNLLKHVLLFCLINLQLTFIVQSNLFTFTTFQGADVLAKSLEKQGVCLIIHYKKHFLISIFLESFEYSSRFFFSSFRLFCKNISDKRFTLILQSFCFYTATFKFNN